MIALELRGITKTYQGKPVLRDVSYAFEQGKTYTICGESGAGKTTLLNIIAGYVRQDAGEVVCMLPKLGYLFQDELLFSNLTVRQNLYIKYCSQTRTTSFEEQAEQILRALHVEELIDRGIALLSGGERQRIQIAQLMIDDPDIILLDEPTSKLDPKHKTRTGALVLEAFQGKTLLIVTHDFGCFGDEAVILQLEGGRFVHEA